MDQHATVEWRNNGVPVSTLFDDPYFSETNGLAETQHVFLRGNTLPDRFTGGFQIAELGFGTGLNLLATRALWLAQETPHPICFTSFEAFPLDTDTIARALNTFPTLERDDFLNHWASGLRKFTLSGGIDVEVIIGDARVTLPKWPGRADAWFLDGFSPAKNPELWSPNLMAEVGRHTAPHGSFATYTAAGFVRRALTEAGFTVTRQAGHGTKRHMTTGTHQ
jgi:tRNA U34 5-methylaminomethyl-2-thiouridine-forming methyltransferase MnmC